MIPRLSVIAVVSLAAMVALAGCGGGATPAPPTPTSAPTATLAVAAPTSAPPTATAVQAGEKVTFEFVMSLSTIEELEPILNLVEEIEGVLGASGSQVDITITYDPTVVTVEELQARMSEIGYPVKAPEGMDHDE